MAERAVRTASIPYDLVACEPLAHQGSHADPGLRHPVSRFARMQCRQGQRPGIHRRT
jgi:hypothetical protein